MYKFNHSSPGIGQDAAIDEVDGPGPVFIVAEVGCGRVDVLLADLEQNSQRFGREDVRVDGV